MGRCISRWVRCLPGWMSCRRICRWLFFAIMACAACVWCSFCAMPAGTQSILKVVSTPGRTRWIPRCRGTNGMDQVIQPAIAFSNSFAQLPERFFVRIAPANAPAPALLKFNEDLAVELGLDVDAIKAGDIAGLFAGNALPPGADPIAMAYAGHQFGNFVPQLGDGRAILLGEVIDRAGLRRDIQLKGSGRTAFSRRGDGRAALGPVLREYLMG